MHYSCALIFASIFLQVFGLPNEIEVFIVPHSHMDAGWLYTIDKYYEIGVNQILTQVIQKMQDERYKFTHGDIFYFKRWYDAQD